jgi:predicted RNase H-like HicB family nuclease
MLIEYIEAAMRRATYEILPEDKSYYGEIPELPGVYAHAGTLEACREELREVVEDWILLGVYLHHSLPIVDGIDLNINVGEAV